MEVSLNYVSGIDDAFVSMYFSKHNINPNKELEIRKVVAKSIDCLGRYVNDSVPEYDKMMKSFCNMVKKHITIGRFVNISCTVYGLHRAGQDDWDAHAKRFDNRIIRNSTRLKVKEEAMQDFSSVSEFYEGKIIPFDQAAKKLGIEIPDKIEDDGKEYIKTINGYILESEKDNPDVQRGLYMLSIPSDFIFNVNLTEFAHVYKERGNHGSANPEVKRCAEEIATQLELFQPTFNRELLMAIQN